MTDEHKQPIVIVVGGDDEPQRVVDRVLAAVAARGSGNEPVFLVLSRPPEIHRHILHRLETFTGPGDDSIRGHYHVSVQNFDPPGVVPTHILMAPYQSSPMSAEDRQPEYKIPRGQRRGPVPAAFAPRRPGHRSRR